MLLVGTNASAQLSASVGFTSSSTTFDVSILKKKTNLEGVYGGLTYNIVLSEDGTGTFGMAPGVYVSYLTKQNAYIAVMKGKINESYLTIPFDFNYSFNVADGTKLVLFAGPSLSCGLSSDVSVNQLTSFGEQNGLGAVMGDSIDMYDGLVSQFIGYDRFDILLGGGIAMDFEDMIRFSIGYDAGLLNRGGSVVGVHRNQLHIGLAYMF